MLDLVNQIEQIFPSFSACLLKMPEPNYEKIVSYCDQVIEADSENSKAHFRRAQALTKLGIYEEALKSCIEAKKYSPFPGKSHWLSHLQV